MKPLIYRTARLLAGALLAAQLLAPYTVSARVMNSTTDIKFTENTGPTNPVDPENPGIVDPEKPGVDGALAILWVSPLSFGSFAITTSDERYYTTTEQPNIQVVDLRGNHSGWAVTAQMSRFQELDAQDRPIALEEGSPGTLRGVALQIENGRLNSQSGSVYRPTVETDIELAPGGGPRAVMAAEPDHGAGLWVNRWYPETIVSEEDKYISLVVPAGAAAIGSHVATITWTIADVPND